MKKALAFFAIVFLFFSATLNAQPPCGFDILHKRLLDSDPSYARRIKDNSIAIRKFIEAHPAKQPRDQQRVTAVYTIPVVVHVMHTGDAVGSIDNPTDAQIQGAIAYLNSVYAGIYPGMTAPIEGGGVVDMEVQFALAQRTPSCGATNGIDRVDASSLPNYTSNGVNVYTSGGIDEVSLKNLSRWNPANYYNIWVVNKIDGADGTSGQFLAGFAYFPGAGSTLDGTIMLATQMIAGQKTLPHEIGHALNLHHPFNGSTSSGQCPTVGTCGNPGIDDEICDTRPVSDNVVAGVYDFTCRTGANSCDGGNPYTINTESNYMSYTNCYTLFTNGQKARAQAAMSLSDRASLVDPGNLALVPCGTSVNFALSGSSRTEDITGTLTGCRRYRDYTYQMTIGAAPSATATATLTFSGTATRGIDYDVTTNGNFGSPSNVLTFNSGSTTAQTFTVRVYDDGDVESAETAVLDFTFNNGGGDATKGTTSPTLTITISDNDTAPVGSSTGTFSIGTSAGSITDAPFDATLQSQRVQFLYKASELTTAGMTAGNITSLQLSIANKASTRPFGNFTIKMGHANPSYLYTNPTVTVISGMTTVYTSASYSTTAGWNTFNLSTPFAWNGSANLAIEICYDNTTADGANAADDIDVYFDGGTNAEGNLFWQNGINCSGSFSSVNLYTFGIKPIIRLSTSVTGTPVETVATSTADMHIDAGSNDFFYSNNSRLLMKLSGISAPLGCVNSTLEGAGTSWVAYSSGQRSAKVFAVTPTTNGGTANYTIALYFDNSELGGKTPATLRIAKTTAASVAASNASNTIIVTPTVTTLGTGTTVFTASFTGFSRFFLVDAAVTLPVELIDFSGIVNQQKNTVLSWATASEFNNRQFDIETSNDGVNFDLLASVASQGNSSNEQRYEYEHVKPGTGTTWYRLKQVDLDGHFKYSNIITVNIDNDIFKPFIYPVPAKDVITVNFGSLTHKTDIEIFTVDMKSVKRETSNGTFTKKDINVHSLPRGIYFMRITAGEGTRLLRFIKE